VGALGFDRVAEVYDRVRPGHPESLLDVALADRSIRDVLEVGCGTGQLTAALIPRGLRVDAVEPGSRLGLVDRLGGTFRIRQLAVVAVAQRR